QTAIDENRRVIIVEGELDFFARVVRPTRGQHLHFAYFVAPEFVTGGEIQNVHQRMPLETVARATLRILCQHDREQVCGRVDSHLHHRAFDLVAAPDRVTSQEIRCFDPCFIAFFKTDQQQVGAGNRRDVRFVDVDVFATPEFFAGRAVDGVERFFSADDEYAEFGWLVEANVVVESGSPRLRENRAGDQDNDKKKTKSRFHTD